MTRSLTERDALSSLSILLYVTGNVLQDAMNHGRWVMSEEDRSELMSTKHFIERLSDKYHPWVEEESCDKPAESSNPPEWEQTATAVEEVSTMEELVYGEDE